MSNAEEALVKPASVAFLSLVFCDVVLATLAGSGSFLACFFVSGSGEKEGNEVKEGSTGGCLETADTFEPVRRGCPRSVLAFLLSVEALDVWEEERLERLLPLSDMTRTRVN